MESVLNQPRPVRFSLQMAVSVIKTAALLSAPVIAFVFYQPRVRLANVCQAARTVIVLQQPLLQLPAQAQLQLQLLRRSPVG